MLCCFGKVQFRPRLVLRIVKGTLQLPPPLCSATERASAQASFFLKGIYVNPYSQTPERSVQCRCSAAHKRGGKSQRSHRFPSTPPELGRWRSASDRPPVCLLHLPPPHLASVQPASQRQVKRSGRTQPRPPRPTREGGVFALRRPRLASRCELLRHLLRRRRFCKQGYLPFSPPGVSL